MRRLAGLTNPFASSLSQLTPPPFSCRPYAHLMHQHPFAAHLCHQLGLLARLPLQHPRLGRQQLQPIGRLSTRLAGGRDERHEAVALVPDLLCMRAVRRVAEAMRSHKGCWDLRQSNASGSGTAGGNEPAI